MPYMTWEQVLTYTTGHSVGSDKIMTSFDLYPQDIVYTYMIKFLKKRISNSSGR